MKNKKRKNKTEFKHLGAVTDDMHILVAVDRNDNAIYIKLDNFENIDNCVEYAKYMSEYLPLLLYNTEVIH